MIWRRKNCFCFNDQPVYTAQWSLKIRSICSWLRVHTSVLNVFFLLAHYRDMEMESGFYRLKEMNFYSRFRHQHSYQEGAYGHRCICFLIIPWVCDFSFNIELSDIILAKFRLCKNTFNASTSNYNWIFLKVNYYHTDWYFQDVTSIKLWPEIFMLNIFK